MPIQVGTYSTGRGRPREGSGPRLPSLCRRLGLAAGRRIPPPPPRSGHARCQPLSNPLHPRPPCRRCRGGSLRSPAARRRSRLGCRSVGRRLVQALHSPAARRRSRRPRMRRCYKAASSCRTRTGISRLGRAGLILEWNIRPAWTGLQDAARRPRRPRPMPAAGREQGRTRRHRLAACPMARPVPRRRVAPARAAGRTALGWRASMAGSRKDAAPSRRASALSAYANTERRSLGTSRYGLTRAT